MLDSSHYAMLEVKEKVLRYMACQKYLGKNYGAVMLLAGSPGAGKTSIAVSIAKAMGIPCVKYHWQVFRMHYFYEEHRQYSIMPSREGLWMLWYMGKASAH